MKSTQQLKWRVMSPVAPQSVNIAFNLELLRLSLQPDMAYDKCELVVVH